ncbi:hypothetical protein GCM10009841_19440 [Microlunatus panaciterrae]|uniref:Transposase n=1 Tax=Microlunatus panaciterrae TaxID=400768 RepID=A0ABS2RPJ0_9ACTN|nr:hypothetical protein [Microlunatus panaciterrae]MBM7800502.1 hypothetical protein [Microlunatus panaciterrae]
MYEMYPDAWKTSDDTRAEGLPTRQQSVVSTDRPRRRARKEHSVTPPVIARTLEER